MRTIREQIGNEMAKKACEPPIIMSNPQAFIHFTLIFHPTWI
jgi:hypothetical protein